MDTLASPLGVPAGGYATLNNIGEKPVVLIAASSPYFGEISMHRSREHGGTITMTPVERITIDPHSSLNFAAAGYHLMMMQPTRSIEPGERVFRHAALRRRLYVDGDVQREDARRGRSLRWRRGVRCSAVPLWH